MGTPRIHFIWASNKQMISPLKSSRLGWNRTRQNQSITQHSHLVWNGNQRDQRCNKDYRQKSINFWCWVMSITCRLKSHDGFNLYHNSQSYLMALPWGHAEIYTSVGEPTLSRKKRRVLEQCKTCTHNGTMWPIQSEQAMHFSYKM